MERLIGPLLQVTPGCCQAGSQLSPPALWKNLAAFFNFQLQPPFTVRRREVFADREVELTNELPDDGKKDRT